MKYEAGNRFNPETYFKTEVDSDTSVTVKVTGELEGVEVSFDSGDVPEITSLSVTENGTYEAPEGTAYDPVTVEVPNSYTAADEGKVVSSGALVSQTSRTVTTNDTYDTTTNNEVVVEVANSYTAADEGKVVSSGALVSQTSRTVTANDTYDTTTNNEVVVNVPSSSAADFIAFIERTGQSLNIPSGTTRIGGYIFYNDTNYTSITIPASVETIRSYAFYNAKGFTSITIPNTVTDIESNAFENCQNLTSIRLPENSTYTSIRQTTFKGTKLASLDVPANITSIAYEALAISTLRSLTLRNTDGVVSAFANALRNVPADCAIYVPADLVESYKADTFWADRATYIQAIPTP